MRTLILALCFYASFAPSPAASHCFRFWHYKHPQHCTYYEPVANKRVQVPTIDSSWYVEITPTDDDLRELGLERLRDQINKNPRPK